MASFGKEIEYLELPHAVAVLWNPLDVCRAETLFCKITPLGNGCLCQLVEMSTLHEWKNPAQVDAGELILCLRLCDKRQSLIGILVFEDSMEN